MLDAHHRPHTQTFVAPSFHDYGTSTCEYPKRRNGFSSARRPFRCRGVSEGGVALRRLWRELGRAVTEPYLLLALGAVAIPWRQGYLQSLGYPNQHDPGPRIHPARRFARSHRPRWYAAPHWDYTELKFEELSPEVQAARLLHCRSLGIMSVRRLAAEARVPVERAELLMCRGLSTLIARGYPAEELCETYHVTPEQLTRAATVPIFSGAFKPLNLSR